MNRIRSIILIFLISFTYSICAELSAHSATDALSELDSFATEAELRAVSDTDAPVTRSIETVVFNNVLVEGSEYIKGDLTVEGSINGGGGTGNVVTGPVSSTTNAVAVFSDTSGNKITDSPVLIDNAGNIDNVGNIELAGITKNSVTYSWPSMDGVANTFLGTDGAGNLTFGTLAGSGNVSTAMAFTADNRIVRTDTVSGSMNIQQSGMTLDDSDNLSGINSLTATTINGTLNGDATNFTGSLVGDVTGTQGSTVVSTVGGQTAANVAAGTVLANAATDANTASAIVRRDASGDFAAGTITADLVGDVTGNVSGTSASATSFTGSLVGDVTGTQGATVVSTVGGQTAADVAAGTVLANAATAVNTASAIVRRDGSGDFAAGVITADLVGDVTGNVSGTAASATNFTGSLVGDVTGTQGATVVSTVGGQTAADVAAGTVLANAATDANTASAIVRRDASGDFEAGTITASLTGNVTGDLTGNADTATSASNVGGQTAANVASATIAANAATATDTANTIVLRDASGNFATNMITLNGTVSNPTDATTKAYVDTAVSTGFTVHDPAVVVSEANVSLSGLQTIDDVALMDSDRVLLVGQTDPIENGLWVAHAGAWTRPTDFDTGNAAGVAYVLILEGTNGGGGSWVCTTPSAIIDTDAISFAEFAIPGQTTGANVGAGTGQIFRDKTGNTINFKTIATGTHVTATNNADDVTISTDATDANTVNTIVARDASGDFAAGTITADLVGDVTGNVSGTAGSATNFTGSLVGDVTGTQGATVVSTVGGQTAANVAAGTVLANAATDANTANAIVRRDASGNFSAGTITANLTGSASDNVLKAGDTMTGSLQVPAGTTAAPSLNFTGSSTTGLSATGSSLSISTAATERVNVSSLGTVSINQFTSPGVVHNDASGNLLSSQIVNADVSASAAIADTKLATISTAGKVSNSATTATSANTAGAIVARDGSGNFSAGTITASLTGSASNNVLKAGDTMTGTLIMPAGTASTPSIQFTGSTNTGFSAATANTLSFDTNGTERMNIDTTSINTLTKFVLMNILCNQAIQAVVPTVGGSVIVASTTSILILRNVANVGGAGFTVTFPASPTNGQFLTIMCGTTNSCVLVNDGNGASIVNPITTLNPNSNYSTSANGASVTYIYYATTNTWYRYARG